ncbi:CCHa2 [Drosophila busckii]|uniref:CCHa2 n=1 Tax=Drosophila busckii TaxID=30019 RepID=A0A0M4F4E3_DROBS|nr:neuropeptide CCHamide-2 [Drosophila busckii]XP_017845589.1 neuropeptide CCHamide-2 [Drosophila busckii]XP_017845590.1 neuropeptide CCHamide-2 [Drosophila busckii]XP_017845591.1 neuropeptide CCHamide-2 [Drosophila busckii]XP_017845592.1 neuropeptide CCHamide-2 [Drosophila busckii]ALC46220.1 CCHa2 [Drosophila busckii]
MKSTISLLVVICTVVLAAQQSQAKKGCQAYGHVCYGGHGKRSLNNGNAAVANEQEYGHPNGNGLVASTNEQAPVVPEPDFDDYPSRQVLYKIMKNWFNRPHRPAARLSELDYPISGESFNREISLNGLN